MPSATDWVSAFLDRSADGFDLDRLHEVPSGGGYELDERDVAHGRDQQSSSSIDEWQMWATIGEERIHLPRGISTRRCRDGWISWNSDVYDTSHADLHTIMVTPELGLDPDVVVPLFHPTDSILVEPSAAYVGADAIGDHLGARRDRRTSMVLEAVGPAMFNGDCTAFEWLAHVPAGDSTLPLRGTSVCRYADGHIVYAADYYDTAAIT